MGILVIVIIAIVLAIIVSVYKAKERKRLHQAYRTALSGTDKRTALAAGRAYYSALRKGGSLTIYDEQAITNDLSTMG